MQNIIDTNTRTSRNQFDVSCEIITNDCSLDSLTATNECSLESLTAGSMEPFSLEDLGMENILDAVEHVLDDNACSSLDPTPIGPQGINVVDEVRLTDMPLLQEYTTFNECLSPLLQKTLEESRTMSKLISNWGDTSYGLDHLLKDPHGSMRKCSGVVSVLSSSSDDTTKDPRNIRAHHSEQWNIRYEELVEFKRTYGHCLVPNYWEKNPRLALWVKRQRYQHKLKKEGQHSTLRDEREKKLEQLGFVWDSHWAMWEERLNELRKFKEIRGHCNVPANFPENRQLAIWVKCQRRQYRLYRDDERSHMTPERISKLVEVGFVWNPRKQKTSR